MNLKPGESKVVIQLDESKAVPVASVTLIVPSAQQDKLEKVDVLVKDGQNKKNSKPKAIVSLQSKDIVKKLNNLIAGVREIVATEIELRFKKKTTGNVNIKLEIKACFHPKTTTTPHTTAAPTLKGKKEIYLRMKQIY